LAKAVLLYLFLGIHGTKGNFGLKCVYATWCHLPVDGHIKHIPGAFERASFIAPRKSETPCGSIWCSAPVAAT